MGGDFIGGNNVVSIFVYSIIGLWIYFLPALHALWKKRRNSGAIFALNLLLGWTAIGWIVALVWSLKNDSEPTQVIVQRSTAPTAYCSGCGKPLEQTAQFCSSCGKQNL
jgi:hypothetical protein